MNITKKFFCALLLLLVSYNAVVAQKPITLDFTTPVYNKPLNYDKQEIEIISNDKTPESGYYERRYITSAANFSGAKFHSNCNFSGLQFQSTSTFSYAQFVSTNNFKSAHFQSTSNFRNVLFWSTSNFESAQFKYKCDFGSAIFRSTSDFSDVHFQSTSNFEWAQFISECYFHRAQFDSASNFERAQFKSTSDFGGAIFDLRTRFEYTKFRSIVRFFGAEFHSSIECYGARFDSTVDFKAAIFAKLVSFRNDTFKHKLILSNISVTDNTVFDFSYAQLPDTIDFSHNLGIFLGVPATIDFTLTKRIDNNQHKMSFWQNANKMMRTYFFPFDTSDDYLKHKINLYNTDVSKIKIDYDQFKFYASETGDTTMKLPPEITTSIYEGLLKNFKDRGQMDSYDQMDIEYNRFKEKKMNPRDFAFLDFWWRYGHEKWRIFIHSILIILLFAIINFFFLHKLNDATNGVYNIANIPEFASYKPGFSIRRLTAFIKRFWYSLIYTAIVFFLLSLKIEKVRFSRPGAIWIMFIYTIGLVCTGFIANLVLQK